MIMTLNGAFRGEHGSLDAPVFNATFIHLMWVHPDRRYPFGKGPFRRVGDSRLEHVLASLYL